MPRILRNWLIVLGVAQCSALSSRGHCSNEVFPPSSQCQRSLYESAFVHEGRFPPPFGQSLELFVVTEISQTCQKRFLPYMDAGFLDGSKILPSGVGSFRLPGKYLVEENSLNCFRPLELISSDMFGFHVLQNLSNLEDYA